jgi:hypothetical protein
MSLKQEDQPPNRPPFCSPWVSSIRIDLIKNKIQEIPEITLSKNNIMNQETQHKNIDTNNLVKNNKESTK